MARPLKLDASGKLKLSEADVVQQVCDFLQLHGWRIYRTGFGSVLDKNSEVIGTVGEVGQPDYQAVRYGAGHYAEVMHMEFKRPKCAGDRGGRLRKDQRNWIALERMRGATCLVIDNLTDFRDWYKKEIGPR